MKKQEVNTQEVSRYPVLLQEETHLIGTAVEYYFYILICRYIYPRFLCMNYTKGWGYTMGTKIVVYCRGGRKDAGVPGGNPHKKR